MDEYQLTYGKCYHLYQRGNHQRALFQESQEYDCFLDLYRKYLRPIADLYAFCLMPTHIHLLFRVKEKVDLEYVYPEDHLLGWQIEMLLTVYTRSVNHSGRSSDPLFDGGAFRELPGQRDLLCKLMVYIHQNPQIHGLVSDFRSWPYSSCFAYLRQDRRSMISKDLLLDHIFRKNLLLMQDRVGVAEVDWYD